MLSKITGAAAMLALLASPAAAIASSPTSASAIAAPAAQSAASNWSTLSLMSSASSSSASLAAVQGDPEYRGGVGGIPLPVIGVMLATIAVFIWILTHDDNDGDGIDFDPISPN